MRQAELATFGDGVHKRGPNIYLITNKNDGKQYVGQTYGTVANRWSQHVGSKSQQITPLQRAVIAEGAAAFKVELIRQCTRSENLYDVENDYIEKLGTRFPSGYNHCRRSLNESRRLATAALVAINDVVDEMKAYPFPEDTKSEIRPWLRQIAAIIKKGTLKNAVGLKKKSTHP